MIRQDYIIRMIQEIFAAIANLILRRKHISKSDWEEYESTARQVLEVTPQQLEEMDGQTILEKYSQEKDGMEKTELAAMMLLKWRKTPQTSCLKPDFARKGSTC